ncbi:MAG TPA: beta-1,6-N-acetylglucosaminyltransferase [Acidimicrobiales bacterium]|nr:beta-1,6-N-acetylglucosaminyltransferase [Acidimicrobiales bacterium]
MVINHRSTAELLRLLRTLRRQQPEAELVVHHDPTRTPVDSNRVERETGAHVIIAPRQVKWGSFELTAAHWRMLDWASEATDCNWFVLLSGQDYPVQPLYLLEEKLAKTTANAYVDAFPCAAAGPDDRRDFYLRYFYQYFWWLDSEALRKVPAPLRPLATRLRDGVARRVSAREGRLYFYYMVDGMGTITGWRARNAPYSDNFPLWKGSNWITTDRRATEALQRYRADHPAYVAHCRRTLLSDESATQTVLMNDASLEVEIELLHCIKWQPPSAHPLVLTSADYDYMVGSGKPFARKFDSGVDPEILDRLDDMLEQASAGLPTAVTPQGSNYG